MPKVKILSRNIDHYIRDSKHDIHKVHRDYNPTSHPFEEAREYVRALNATKLERSFAKPFLFDLKGNNDAVSVLINNKNKLNSLFSGGHDGVIKEWNLSSKSSNFSIKAHSNWVTGLAQTGNKLISIGNDKLIKFWDLDPLNLSSNQSQNLPSFQIACKADLKSLDSQYSKTSDNYLAVGDSNGEINLYEQGTGRTDSVITFNWNNSTDTVNDVKFNPTEQNLLLTCGMNRSICLYDIRQNSPLKKVTLEMNSNQCLWNPHNPLQFAIANEDNNTYLFDTRRLDHASKILKGHISSVMSLSYSPTGRQLVTGSYDKTIKIYNIHGNSSSNAIDTYHTKRMQKVASVLWSLDNKYILSASDEFNIRCWKAKAWDRLEYLSASQKKSRDLAEALKKKYQNHPEIRRISKHRHVSKHIFVQSQQRREQLGRKKRKERNRKLHIPGHETKPAREAAVVKVYD